MPIYRPINRPKNGHNYKPIIRAVSCDIYRLVNMANYKSVGRLIKLYIFEPTECDIFKTIQLVAILNLGGRGWGYRGWWWWSKAESLNG